MKGGEDKLPRLNAVQSEECAPADIIMRLAPVVGEYGLAVLMQYGVPGYLYGDSHQTLIGHKI